MISILATSFTSRPLRQLALACLLLPLSIPAVAAVSSSIPTQVQKALTANKIGRDSLGVMLVPLTGSGTTTAINADKPMNPASTMKLVTSWAALELLGPTYTWKTAFYSDGVLRNGVLNGNLYLKGGGDPKLNLEKLWLLMRDLRANGVQQITGDLVVDRSYFIQPAHSAFNDDGGDKNKPYLVGPDSLLVNLKAVRIITRAEDDKISVSLEPPMAKVRIDNRVKLLKRAKCPGWPDVRYNPVSEFDGITLIVTGKINAGCSSQSYISLFDHANYAAGAVRAIWQELGGKILGKDRQGTVPKQATLLASASSPDLVEIIRDINKYSNNTMARQLFLSIGAKARTSADQDDAQAAQRAIKQLMRSKGINPDQLVMENGSGLSRNERISANELSLVLQDIWNGPYAAEFTASLPLVGMDGTMRKRLRNTPMLGQAHIKTGTLNNVRAIAGFSRDRNGQTWAVVAMLNDPRPWGASATLDLFLTDLWYQPKKK
ncbi:D-alanyl-D-alanine carboxypeptidase / D-alanyl-D-alanine-endopeptidase (penicillin-binding protein 4) [Pseudomonas pohangensis]|uniref:D-alanyl-D-alanine carboxypeptidase / D-alanyl-D-alanine-endopeptidase (Penicillin-binding protein 4) n=1 Tax=Pseudomonas pohangensis TaxID=364197 RepID=A0A1H2EIA0_9PSED|nr:D-alanyl-D-alanine carboxypeptidase/D-alanyl-D-alanine-endopeptidase [Pseudomonas pohangensis]SDT94810.1 D-alanyl-D-alanine carboxypeptidase / D-alanyl-D-alanine-endopeptidase (penicillin-binding protein 4) [Pseudomonas pohangensis]